MGAPKKEDEDAIAFEQLEALLERAHPLALNGAPPMKVVLRLSRLRVRLRSKSSGHVCQSIRRLSDVATGLALA
jgi:hypothetical protein